MRNEKIEKSVQLVVDLIDRLNKGESLGEPASLEIKNIFDTHVEKQGGSVRLACVFLAAYSLIDRD